MREQQYRNPGHIENPSAPAGGFPHTQLKDHSAEPARTPTSGRVYVRLVRSAPGLCRRTAQLALSNFVAWWGPAAQPSCWHKAEHMSASAAGNIPSDRQAEYRLQQILNGAGWVRAGLLGRKGDNAGASAMCREKPTGSNGRRRGFHLSIPRHVSVGNFPHHAGNDIPTERRLRNNREFEGCISRVRPSNNTSFSQNGKRLSAVIPFSRNFCVTPQVSPPILRMPFKEVPTMARITGRSFATRVLERLTCAEYKSVTADQHAVYLAAWHVVHGAYFKKSPSPFTDAIAIVRRQYPHFGVLQMAPPQSQPSDFPAPVLWNVDGRNGRQWMLSIVGYLAWRAGTGWRSLSQRNEPTYAIYTRAIFTVSCAFWRPDPPHPPAPAAEKVFRAAA